MPPNTPVRISGPLGWAIAGIAAGALFAAGLLTARAIFDGSSDTAPASGQANTGRPPSSNATPGPTRPGIPASVGRGDEDVVGPKGGYDGPYGCPAPLPPELVGSTSLDLAAAGLTPRVPRSGFDLTSLAISALADCTPEGTPTGDPRPSLSTTWRHTATNLEVYVTQTVSSSAVAPVLRPDGATFTALGYHFTIYVNAYPFLPAGGGPPTASPAKPHPRTAEVLRDAIAQIVPGLDQQCFWTLADGDWNDLATYGVGDPRPAIPTGFTLQETHVAAFRPPAAPCDTTIKPTDGFGLYATWTSRDGESLGVSVTGLPDGTATPYPGYLDQYGATWISRGLQFSIWYAVNDKNGDANLIRAIARALDPSFDDACFVTERTVAEAELAALGFRAPQPPPGYTITASTLIGTDIPAGCQRPQGFFPSYSLSWTLEQGADSIEVNIYSTPGAAAGQGFSGWLSDHGLGWITDDGTTYSIAGSTKGISPTVPRDDLIAVAKSLYPELDITKLIEAKSDGGPGGAVPPRPAPEKPTN